PSLRRDQAVPGRSMSILVIDNDSRIVEATSALLSGMGHIALGAMTGRDALALCDQADAVLADYQLDHGEDGLTVIGALWARRPDLPVRLVTAESGEAMVDRARRMGVTILAKPVDPDRIAQFLFDASVLQIKPE
ncbi:MAG: response regulator, partial [Sphingomonadales bacterium]|nr:response regulator [Sphingomonadales bacterium]